MDISEKAQKNLRIFPYYKMFAWDLLFYYAIIFIFLVKAKGFTASQIFFVDAFYPIFKFTFQFICIHIADSLGKYKALLIGNIFINLAILAIILCTNFYSLIFANLLLAIGYNLKDFCEPPFLSSSILNKEKKKEIFTRTEGNANAKFYFFDALCSIIAGLLFTLNNYLPLIFCLICSVVGTIIAFHLEAIEEPVKIVSHKRNNLYKSFKSLILILRDILKSKRMISLIIYSAFFTSLVVVFKTYMNSLLVDLHLSDIYFGIIFALISIISAISSRHQSYFHKKYKNRALTVFVMPILISMFLTGITVSYHFSPIIMYLCIIMMVLFYAIFRGPYYTLIKRYLNSFVPVPVATKIYAIESACDSIVRSLTYFFSSFLFNKTTTSFALIVFSGVFLLIFIAILDYMKPHVGLKPEEYPDTDMRIGIH